MKILISSFAFQGFPPKEVFLFAREAGFDGVELIPMPRHALMGGKKIKAMAQKYGAPIVSVHQPPWHWPNTTRGMIRGTALFAGAMGAESITIHLALLRFHRHGNLFSFIKKVEEQTGVKINLENNSPPGSSFEFPKRWAWHPKTLGELLKSHDMGLTLDNAHLISSGGEPASFFAEHKDKIRQIHFHNIIGKNDHAPFFGRPEEEKIMSLLDTLKKHSYNGILTLEIFPANSLGKRFTLAETKEILKKSLDIVRDRLKI